MSYFQIPWHTNSRHIKELIAAQRLFAKDLLHGLSVSKASIVLGIARARLDPDKVVYQQPDLRGRLPYKLPVKSEELTTLKWRLSTNDLLGVDTEAARSELRNRLADAVACRFTMRELFSLTERLVLPVMRLEATLQLATHERGVSPTHTQAPLTALETATRPANHVEIDTTDAHCEGCR